MCFTVDQIDRACGLLLLNEFNTFVYCCKECGCEFDCGSNLEVHILSEHQDDKGNIERLFVDDDIFVDRLEQKSEQSSLEQQVENHPTASAVSIEPIESTDIKTEEVKENDGKVEQLNKKLVKERRKTSVAEKRNTKNVEESTAKIEEPIEPNTEESNDGFTFDDDFNNESSNDDRKDDDTYIPFPNVKPTKKRIKKPNAEVFYCDMCPGTTYSSIEVIKQHMKRHVQNRVRKRCPICNKLPLNYEKHIKMNHMETHPYKCEFCEKTFKCNSNRQIHQRLHTGETPFLCSSCGKAFTSLNSQNRHEMRMHSERLPHSCKECDRTFISPSMLQDHINSFHTNVRPHTCDVCGKSYSTKKYLRTHKLFHGNKKFQCRHCENMFFTSETRRFHEKTVHNIV